jgi:ABC-type dipeptide/oligopeptide/nickel transport system ATPase subunit
MKMGSGMGTLKQFLLSILATTVSIALTFGTSAIIDNNKKQREKREIVMMVVYDMSNSLKQFERADSMLQESVKLQLKVAEDTSQFQELRFRFGSLLPVVNYTETTERIFSTSIETINTVGNVLFTENVALFYQNRKNYTSQICDTLRNRFSVDVTLANVKNLLDFDYAFTAAISHAMVADMRHLIAQCQEMMGISDEDLENYRRKRQEMEKKTFDKEAVDAEILDNAMEWEEKIQNAKKKLNLE